MYPYNYKFGSEQCFLDGEGGREEDEDELIVVVVVVEDAHLGEAEQEVEAAHHGAVAAEGASGVCKVGFRLKV